MSEIVSKCLGCGKVLGNPQAYYCTPACQQQARNICETGDPDKPTSDKFEMYGESGYEPSLAHSDD